MSIRFMGAIFHKNTLLYRNEKSRAALECGLDTGRNAGRKNGRGMMRKDRPGNAPGAKEREGGMETPCVG